MILVFYYNDTLHQECFKRENAIIFSVPKWYSIKLKVLFMSHKKWTPPTLDRRTDLKKKEQNQDQNSWFLPAYSIGCLYYLKNKTKIFFKKKRQKTAKLVFSFFLNWHRRTFSFQEYHFQISANSFCQEANTVTKIISLKQKT